MVSKIKLMKTVERAFKSAGWTVGSGKSEMFDFKVDHGALSLFIKCVDSNIMKFCEQAKILLDLERYSSHLKRSRQLIVIFESDFLTIPLDSLDSYGIFALTIAEIALVTDLATVSQKIPNVKDRRQIYLLERCAKYAALVSKLHSKNGDINAAIEWGQLAVKHSSGFSQAYFSLFGLLKDGGQYDAAAELGEQIRSFQPDDPHFLRGMEDLARRRGNKSEALEWRQRRFDHPTTPRTLDDILRKQRMANSPKTHSETTEIHSVEIPSKYTLSKLMALLRQPFGR